MVGALDEQAIRESAYFIWEREGHPEGQADDHWKRALAELQAAAPAEISGDASNEASVPQRQWEITEENADELLLTICSQIAKRCSLRITDAAEIIDANGDAIVEWSSFEAILIERQDTSLISTNVVRALIDANRDLPFIDRADVEKRVDRNVLQGRLSLGYCGIIFGIILCSRIDDLSLGVSGLHVHFAQGLPFEISELLNASQKLTSRLDDALVSVSRPVNHRPSSKKP